MARIPSGRAGARAVGVGEEVFDGGQPSLALPRDHAQLDELLPQGGLVGADAKRAVGASVGELAGFLDEPSEVLQLRDVEAEPGAGVQEQGVVPGGQGSEQFLERHLLAVDGDGDVEVEPVAVLGVVCREEHDGGLRGLLVGHRVALLLHLHPCFEQVGEDVGEERGGRHALQLVVGDQDWAGGGLQQ